MDIQLGYWRWKIYRWNEHPNPFRGRSDLALEWLRRFQNNRMVMAELRDKLASAGANLPKWSDDGRVLQEVADRLSSGEFQVCAESSHPFQTAAAVVTPPDPEAEAAAQILAAPREAPPPPPPAPAAESEPEPTLSSCADPAATAENLKQAAGEGVPFCEECAKAAAGQQIQPSPVPPPAPESTLPGSADAAAIAQSLQNAASDGTPFCEECERARRAQAGEVNA